MKQAPIRELRNTAGSRPSLQITLAAQILTIIRRENFPLGQRLTEAALTERLGVSRSPVRKAMQHLASLGVLRSEPHKGFVLALPATQLQAFDVSAPESCDEELYLKIANDRIQGVLGEEIIESDLMDRYHSTRLQIQRVLHRMTRESMVEPKPGRGWIFRTLLTDTHSHIESYRYRMIIEPAAILEPGYAVNAEELKKCRREQEQLLQGGIEQCTHAELFRAGVHLHETIVAGANNRFLLDSLKSINNMRRVVEYGTRLDRARLHRQCEEHLKLIDLLLGGECMEAAHFLRQHLNGARITKVEQQNS